MITSEKERKKVLFLNPAVLRDQENSNNAHAHHRPLVSTQETNTKSSSCFPSAHLLRDGAEAENYLKGDKTSEQTAEDKSKIKAGQY